MKGQNKDHICLCYLNWASKITKLSMGVGKSFSAELKKSVYVTHKTKKSIRNNSETFRDISKI